MCSWTPKYANWHSLCGFSWLVCRMPFTCNTLSMHHFYSLFWLVGVNDYIAQCACSTYVHILYKHVEYAHSRYLLCYYMEQHSCDSVELCMYVCYSCVYFHNLLFVIIHFYSFSQQLHGVSEGPNMHTHANEWQKQRMKEKVNHVTELGIWLVV